MLRERGGAKRAPTAHRAKNGARLLSLILYRHLDACPDRGAVGLHTNQIQADPIIAIPGILEKSEGVAVAQHRPAGFGEEIFIAVVVNISKGNAVSLM